MTGAATWQFSHDLCNLNTNEPKHLKMTVCSNDEFTCARVRKDWQFNCISVSPCLRISLCISMSQDGLCISMDKRCDQFPNCEDFSDERGCKLVILPESYVKDFTPFTLDELGDIAKVNISIKVRV